MTSAATDADTKAFFRQRSFFGLDESQIVFFQQVSNGCPYCLLLYKIPQNVYAGQKVVTLLEQPDNSLSCPVCNPRAMCICRVPFPASQSRVRSSWRRQPAWQERQTGMAASTLPSRGARRLHMACSKMRHVCALLHLVTCVSSVLSTCKAQP